MFVSCIGIGITFSGIRVQGMSILMFVIRPVKVIPRYARSILLAITSNIIRLKIL